MEFDPHFLRPLWLLALIPAAVLFWLYQRRARADSHWHNAVDAALLDVLLDDGRRGRAPPGWPLALATAAIILGLAGPTWERLPQPVEQRTDALVIALDLSLSMYAQDVAPSRLVRARQEIIDVLRARKEGYTALVAYAGSAHTVAPLTDDVRTIQNLLDALEPAMMPVQGSNPKAAMQLVHKLFDNARVTQGRVLLVTDGIDRINDVSEFRNAAYPVSVLGIGTPEGGTIPLDFVNQPGRFLQTREGEVITARLDDERLASVAELAFGRYARQRLDDSDLNEVLASSLPGDDETVDVEREFDLWHDLGYWLAIAALPFLLLGFRRGVLAACVLVIAPIDAHAGLWDDLWRRGDQQGYDALRHGEPERAVTLFDDPSWLGVARYRSGDFAGAAQGFSQFDDVTGTYNLGNALAKAGNLQAAIAAYDSVLQRDPSHEDAAFNKALVRKLMEEQSEGSEEDNQEQQQDSENSSESERESDGSPSDAQEDEQNQSQDSAPEEEGAENQEPPDDPQPGEEGEEQQDSDQESQPRDESEEAMEQWLRRVPDDPGGLLRRKFQFENQQRLRRGDYSQRQQEKIW